MSGERKEDKYLRVLKKVDEIRKFNYFVVIAIFGSLFMMGFAYFLFANDAEHSLVPITIFLSTPFVFLVIGMSEYIKIHNRFPFFSKKWEEKKMQAFLDIDKHVG